MKAILIFLLSFSVVFATVVQEKRFKIDSRTRAILKLYDKPVFKMYWIKLEKGGYLLSGDVSPFDTLNCSYLTDLSFDEIEEFLKKEYGYIHNLPVNSLKAIVRVNREPALANPYNPFINPTVFENVEEFNTYLRKVVKEKLKKDENLKRDFERFKKIYIKNGLSDKEATKKAFFRLIPLLKLKPKAWIPEEKLPKKLYLVCNYSFAKVSEDYRVQDEWEEYRVYPVILEIRKENYIEIERLEKNDNYLFLDISFFPIFQRNRSRVLSLDLITINPIPVDIKGCKYGYIGGIIDNADYKTTEYSAGLSNENNKFYLNIYPQADIKEVKLRLRLGIYCSRTKKERISLLNPDNGDKANLNELIMMNYKFNTFLKRFGINNLRLKFQIVSPQGYKSDIFSIEFP